MNLTYGSICSGIEAATVAWHPLGWRPAFFCENAPFQSTLLAAHYPETPNHGDLRGYETWPLANIDVLIGGTPCQSFSVAGGRAGLGDPRGALLGVYCSVVERFRPRVCVWENVPGARSADAGRAMGTLFGLLAKCGYGWAYRSLDAQYFGLAQRRERVFVVGHLGGWRRAAAILFDLAGLQGNPPPSREKGQSLAPTIAGCSNGGGANGPGRSADDATSLVAGTLRETDGGPDLGHALAAHLVPELSGALSVRDSKGTNSGVDQGPPLIVHAIQAGATRENPASGPDGIGVQANLAYTLEARAEVQMVAHTLRGAGFDATEDGTGRGTPLVPVAFNARQDATYQEDLTGPLDQDGSTNAVAFSGKDHGADAGALAPTLRAMGHAESHANGGGQISVAGPYGVRRLTPRECERLQGFPDDYTLIRYRGRPAADGPRYQALGNSMAVPVIQWLGRRIELSWEA